MMNRNGVVEFLALRGRVIEHCRNKRLSDPTHSNEVNSAMMCPVRKGTTKGVLKGRKSGMENKEKARVRKNTITHHSMVIHDRIFMCHYRYRTFSDWYEEVGNHENRPLEKHRIELRRVWQLRCERNIERRKLERTRSCGYTFNLSMEPAIEFMEFDRTDKSIIEPESAFLRYSLATKLETKN